MNSGLLFALKAKFKIRKRSKMVRCKEAKKSRTRSHAQISSYFSLTQQIAVLGQPAQLRAARRSLFDAVHRAS